MNDLNSTLIEGTAIENAKFESETVCRFSIYSNRYFNNDEKIKKEVMPVIIEAQSKLAETCKHAIHKGRNIRAVGRLKQITIYNSEYKVYIPHLIIEAEHIELRPEIKNKKDYSPESAFTEPFIENDKNA